MKKFLLTTAKVLFAIVIVFGALFIYRHYQEDTIRSFCAETSYNATPTDVLESAKKRSLPTFNFMKERNTIIVLNHKSPLFRMACEVKFKDNKIVSKGVVGAD